MGGKSESERGAATAEPQWWSDRIGPTLNGHEEDEVGVLSAVTTVRKQVGLAEQWGQNDAERKGSSDLLAGNDSGVCSIFQPAGLMHVRLIDAMALISQLTLRETSDHAASRLT